MRACEAIRAELLEGRTERAREHLAACAACREFAGDVPRLFAEVRAMPPSLTEERAAELLLALQPTIADAARVNALTHASRPVGQTLTSRASNRVLASLQPAITRAIRRTRGGPWPVRLAFAGGGMALAAAVVLITVVAEPVPRPLVVEVEHDGGTVQKATRIAPGQIVATGPAGRVHFRAERGRVAVEESSRLELVRLDAEWLRVRLDAGRIVAAVDPAGGTPRYVEVVTPLGTARVKGTLFSVTVSTDVTTIAVQRGEVEVEASNGLHSVRGGEVLDVTRRGTRRKPLDASEAAGMATAWSFEVHDEVDAESESELELESEPEPEPESASGGSGVRPNQKQRAASGKCQRLLDAHGADVLGAMGAVDCFLGEGKIKRAQEVYLRVAQQGQGTLAAENAAYEWGRLLDHHGRHRLARQALSKYLRTYPNGLFRDEARFRQCAIDVRTEKLDSALRCLSSFRATASLQSKRFTESLWLTATILREHTRDCSAAADMYRAYVERRGPKTEDALEWIRWCEREER